jgi:hypothetical protein
MSAQLTFRMPRPRRAKVKRRAPGAGRPRIHGLPEGWDPRRRFVPHLKRAVVNARQPAHVTLRLRRVVRTLRNGKMHRTITTALRAGRERPGFRLVHYSLQGDHLHLIAEADDAERLARGMQGLNVRIARAVNRCIDRSGPVLADRYHARQLRSPTEVRLALRYVLNNARHHAAERDMTYPRSWLDPFSSARELVGWSRVVPDPEGDARRTPPCTAPPRSWVLKVGWQRAGLIDPADVPGSTPAPGFDDD